MNQAQESQKAVIRLKNASWKQLRQVPFMDFVEVFNRAMLVILSACFAGFGAESFAIGASVFCGLCAIVGAIGKLKD